MNPDTKSAQAVKPLSETVRKLRVANLFQTNYEANTAMQAADELEAALADSALKSLRILELEKELAAIKPTRRERPIEQDKAIDAMQAGGGE